MAKSASKDRAGTDNGADKGAEAGADEAALAGLPQSYEAGLAELDALVARMEGGSLSLEESLAAYRRGAVLVKFCQQQLEKVEQQVRVLDGETLRPVPLNTTGSSAAGGDDDL
ncbi:exodeoxyribonuclease VII small subunit [Paraburkholderia silviterrae]|uniref:Exodeoxyribonuclease 7 small subunit n=1 Tax=Paraburkholderia silviterrae TaxID=2528715 RepID=A0A4V2ZZP4_9BURK|nr:exodeoxyribonuclease VII small subunit [Paraburkholderia silviterrae]TDG26234.1 exodeoxyribonuclease VII small subunit [Paraburkholderia silviterrae]